MKLRVQICYLLLSCTLVVHAQVGDFVGISGSINTVIVDMNLQHAATNAPVGVFIGGGAAYSISLKENFNARFGLDFLRHQPNNVRGYYDECSSLGLDYSCLPEMTVAQLYFPIGTEFYLNTNYRPYHTFFIFSIIPSFSITEKKEMTVYDQYLKVVDQYTEKRNGFVFQDIVANVALGNEFVIIGNLKLFIEPSVQISMLFRKQNFVNPLTGFNVKVGLRHRSGE